MGYRVDYYLQACNYLNAGRGLPHGRKLNAAARVKWDGSSGSVVITWYNMELCRIYPNDTCTFTAPTVSILGVKESLSGALQNVLPFWFNRYAKNQYRIAHQQSIQPLDYGTHAEKYRWLRNEAPMYFEGITFSLTTGECLNYRPDPVKNPRPVDPAKRKEWLATCDRYRLGLKTRLRMGVASSLKNERYRMSVSAEHIPQIAKWMKEDQYPMELYQLLVDIYWRRWSSTGTWEELYNGFRSILKNNSEALREQFDVFTDKGVDKEV